MNEAGLQSIIKRKGYGISSSIGRGSFNDKDNSARALSNVEPSAKLTSLGEGKVALNYTGRPIISFKVYRKRLTDMPRSDCEKYFIDGVVYANLVLGDAENQIQFKDEGHEKVEDSAQERVEIRIEYEGVDLDNPIIPYEKAKEKLS